MTVCQLFVCAMWFDWILVFLLGDWSKMGVFMTNPQVLDLCLWVPYSYYWMLIYGGNVCTGWPSQERERKHKEAYGLLEMQLIPMTFSCATLLLLFLKIFITVINLSHRHTPCWVPCALPVNTQCNAQMLSVMDILGCQLHYFSNQLKRNGLGMHSLVVFLPEVCPISSYLPRLLTSINKNLS